MISSIGSGLDDAERKSLFDSAAPLIAKAVPKFVKAVAKKKRGSLISKKLLADHIKKAKGQMVVVNIDELDRCSPTYAICLLERLKHLFGVKMIIFLLIWNMGGELSRQLKPSMESKQMAQSTSINL